MPHKVNDSRTEHARSSFHPGLVLGVMTLLSLVLTWPLVTSLSSRVPGTATWAFDESTFLWNIWYFKHAVVNLHTSPLYTDLIWFPLGIDLILYTYNFFNALLALPLLLATSLPLASNITLLLSTILSGFGTYLLVLYVLRPSAARHHSFSPQAVRWAALLAGIVYAFGSNRAVYTALGHYDMVTTQWLPFFALYLLKTLHQPRLRNAVLAGLFFTLAALAEMIFASFLATLALVVLAASWRGLVAPRAALARVALAAGVALLLWSPALLPIVREFLSADYALTGWGEGVKLSADVQGLLTPTDLNPLLRPDDAFVAAAGETADVWQTQLRAVEKGQGRFSDINTVFLGFVTLGLALLGIWIGRGKVRIWVWSAVLFGVLALGPLLQIGGRYRFSLDNLLPEGITFPLPFALLHFVPIINANRAPNRNSVILMLALAVLVAYGAAWLIERLATVANRARPLGRRSRSLLMTTVTIALAVAVIVEHLALPLPTTDARVPDIYAQIAAEPEQFSVMHLPLGWRNSFGVFGSERTQLQYYQATHGKPMIGGNISRNPEIKMDYFRRIALFQALTELEMYRDVPPEVDAAARAQAGALMALYDVRYFITHPPIPGRFPYQDTWERTQEYALDVLPLEQPAFWSQDGVAAYRVVQPAVPSPFKVDLGSSGTEPYLGAGWDLNPGEHPYHATGFWATARHADLYLPMGEPADAQLRIALAPLAYPGAPAQTVSVRVNGTRVLEQQPLVEGWQTVTASVPAAATRRGANHVQLEFAWTASPRQVFPDADSRAVIGATGTPSPVNIDVHSFSEAYISVFTSDGHETNGSVGRRGYNIALIDPRSGEVTDQRGFDTAANSYEAEQMALFLEQVQAGTIVVVATKEDATAYLTPAAIAGLRGVGSRVETPADLMGQAHALVGIRGAEPGSAAEASAPDSVFLRVAGDFRSLAAAVDWVEIESIPAAGQ